MSQVNLLYTLVLSAIALAFWAASANSKLDRVQKQLDLVLSNFDGLREYLYEIDPQFNDERSSDQALEDESNIFGAYDDLKLLERKRAEGKRTLNTPFQRAGEG